jgi:hypothetical protein
MSNLGRSSSPESEVSIQPGLGSNTRGKKLQAEAASSSLKQLQNASTAACLIRLLLTLIELLWHLQIEGPKAWPFHRRHVDALTRASRRYAPTLHLCRSISTTDSRHLVDVHVDISYRCTEYSVPMSVSSLRRINLLPNPVPSIASIRPGKTGLPLDQNAILLLVWSLD